MIFAILFGAGVFTQIFAYLQIPAKLANLAVTAPVNRWFVLIFIQILVIFLGSFLDCASILAIVVPIFNPVIMALGFDPLWFGILLMINMEIATLTPPVGLNLYVLKGILPATFTMGRIFKGCIPFTILHLTTMVLVMVIPELATWLPSLMK
jgi:C4-dicarboxylate transporter DctM subunit